MQFVVNFVVLSVCKTQPIHSKQSLTMCFPCLWTRKHSLTDTINKTSPPPASDFVCKFDLFISVNQVNIRVLRVSVHSAICSVKHSACLLQKTILKWLRYLRKLPKSSLLH